MTEETHYVIKCIDLQDTMLSERALQRKCVSYKRSEKEMKETDRQIDIELLESV